VGYHVGLILAASKPLVECVVEQLFLVLASGDQLERLVLGLAVGSSVVEVNLERHLEPIVLELVVEVDTERHQEQPVLTPQIQQQLLFAPEQHLE